MVESTSKRDRTALVKWPFSAASLHPEVKSISSITKEKLNEANKRMGNLLMRLLTESCKKEAEKALEFEGDATMQASFQVLGQVAGRELFASPEVAEGMAGLEKYLDKDKLESLNKKK